MRGFPYHVTHRGNRLASIFFSDDDRHWYLSRLAEQSARHGRILERPPMGRPRKAVTPEAMIEDLVA